MGAGASAQEQEELRAAFSEFVPNMTSSQLELVLKRVAPNVYQHLQAQVGNDPAGVIGAVQALQDQFTHAYFQLNGGMDDSSNAGHDQIVAPVLSRYHSWAADKETNLNRGLVASTLRTTHVRTVRFIVGYQAGQAPAQGPESFVLRALLDTGAERCAMAPSAADKSGLTPLIDETFAHTVVGVGSSRGHGRVHYATISFAADSADPAGQTGEGAITIDGQGSNVSPTFLASFDVFDWPTSAGTDFDAILGLDFLVRYQGVIDFATNTLALNTTARDAPNFPGGGRTQPSAPSVVTIPLQYQKDAETQDAATSAKAAADAAQLAAEIAVLES